MASILQRGTINRNDLSVHHGLLNRAPRITATMMMVESNKNEDMIGENEYLEEAKKMNGEERGNHKQGNIEKDQ